LINKKSPRVILKGFLFSPGELPGFTNQDYLVGVVEEAAGATTAFLLFFIFLAFFTLWLTFVVGVEAGAVPCAKTRPVVLPKKRTVIKTANNFFMEFLQTLSGR
jgi:hypothetical protein